MSRPDPIFAGVPTDEKLQPGDLVVSVGDNRVKKTDINNLGSPVIGVISTDPGFIIWW